MSATDDASLFQFQNGSINRAPAIMAGASIVTFQFQNGSINSMRLETRSPVLPSFQFQNGSINSKKRLVNPKGYTSFNSKMVRLIAGGRQ